MPLRIADCGLRIADCGLRIADCGLRIADCGLELMSSVTFRHCFKISGFHSFVKIKTH